MKPGSVIRGISRHLSLAITLELAVGLLISVGALLAFAGLSEEVFEGETSRLDTALLLWIHSTFPGWLDAPLRVITALGYTRVVVPLLLLAAYAFYRKGLKLSAALLLVSVPGAAILGTALKSFYGRARPQLFDSGYEASFFSFPSGHAITAVSFYGVLTLLTARHLGGRGRWSLVTAGAVLVLLIGFSRLYLGVHYPSDVVAGYLAAALWVGTVGMALRLWRSLRDVRRDG
jgi:undecaprenyl-diphosphatase